jgi:hypothetical protein
MAINPANKPITTKAPNLPLAPIQYSQQYQDQFLNVLRLYFNQIDNFTFILSAPPSGTTANRPTINLFVGQMYFDTDLNYPIWWDGTDWVDSTGTVV